MKHKALEIPTPKKGEPIKAILYIDDELSFINADLIKEDILSHINEFDHLLIQVKFFVCYLFFASHIHTSLKSCAAHDPRGLFWLWNIATACVPPGKVPRTLSIPLSIVSSWIAQKSQRRNGITGKHSKSGTRKRRLPTSWR